MKQLLPLLLILANVIDPVSPTSETVEQFGIASICFDEQREEYELKLAAIKVILQAKADGSIQ